MLNRLRSAASRPAEHKRPPTEDEAVGLKPQRQRFQRYLLGHGIEIGALHNPMPVDTTRARVRHVDRVSLAGQREHYPELIDFTLVPPDIIAEADQLTMVEDNSEDFLIANHLMEHLPDPIGALKEWHRVLKPGGILFLALPDKRFTFDKDRPRTALAHLIADHDDRGSASRLAHYEEYSRLVHGKTGDDLRTDVDQLLARQYSIHFHVWVKEDVDELLGYLRDRGGLSWTILEQIDTAPGSDEFIYVLKKAESSANR